MDEFYNKYLSENKEKKWNEKFLNAIIVKNKRRYLLWIIII
jgi:hypothetical protein